MRTLTIAALLTCIATAAHSETCTFTIECFEGEDCTGTEVEMTVGTGDGGATTLETISETLRVTATVSDDETYDTVTAKVEGAEHRLTRTTGGDALYAVTLTEGPMNILYLGTCKASGE